MPTDSVPSWVIPWAVWAIVTRKLNIPMERPANAPKLIPKKYVWIPAWVWWRMNGRKTARPPGVPYAVPIPILELYQPIALRVRYIQQNYVPPPYNLPNKGEAIWRQPGLFTDAASGGSRPVSFWQERGYKWIIQQAQNVIDPNGSNALNMKPISIENFRSAGFKVGMWGCTYNAKDFKRDGEAMLSQALKYNCELLVVDAEECLKNADPTPLIQAVAPFKGIKALSTLGAAYPPNVFPIRYDLFLAAGFDILAQAYTNYTPYYRPALCVDHAARARIPLERHHLTVDFSGYSAYANGQVSAQQWKVQLEEARIHSDQAYDYNYNGNDVSIFMSEFGSDDDYRTLDSILKD